MPKLKPTATELKNRQTQAVFDYAVQKENLDYKDIAKHFHCTPRTVHNKRRNPETLTLIDIRAIIKLGKLTDAQIVELIAAR